MNSLNLRLPSRRTGYVAATFMLLFATITSAFASAAQITSRSIALSSSTADASGVTYQVNFTGVSSAGAVVIEFCNDSPLLGATCTAPGGFSLSSATASGGTIDGTHTTASKITLTSTVNASANTITLSNVHNPTATGPLYARIVTYDTLTHAQGYTTATPGTHVDDGGVAMDITSNIGVDAAVLESLTFCVSGATITAAGCASGLQAPSLTLGETTGSVKALSAAAVSTGDLWAQISTNAASGAVVSLKSGNNCGGLARVGAAGCDIAPALQTDITAGQAKLGVKVAADTSNDTALSANGTFQAKTGSGYGSSAYALNYLANASSGVTSVYGDPILETNGTQPSNKEMKLTFGASITNNTPAGAYANNYSLVATGTF